MSLLRRAALAVVLFPLLALAVAACGSSDDGGDAGTAAGTTTAAGETRTVEHAMGTTDVSGTPKRVVVLDTPELELAAALGIRPVGSVRADVGLGVPRYLVEMARGSASVGTIQEPNLIEIARLKPDLILGSKLRHEQLYDQLTAIAPTVFTDTPADWKANIRTNAAALNQTAEAARLLADYEQRARALGERLGDPAGLTVAVVRFVPGEIRLYSPRSFIGSVLKDVGVTLPPAAERATDINATLSLENLDEANAEVIYTTVYGPEQDTDMEQALRLPSWRALDAVRAGAVHEEPDDVWMLGIGTTGAGKVLDELEATLPRSGS
jgi:iron complex transport system substrate-binding protein